MFVKGTAFSRKDIRVQYSKYVYAHKALEKQHYIVFVDHLSGLVVRVLGYRSGGPGSIPGTTRKKRKSSGSGTGSTQPCEYN
jgi:hypothetical protein